MSIYTTQVSKLTKSDLDELLADNAIENLRLEFKSEVPKPDETLKKLSSFANTAGGILVVGAEATDGKIIGFPGVPLESGYKQRIADWSFIKFNPPIMMECSEPIQLPNNRYCYVISVPESELAPHFINGRKGLWVRTDEFSNRFEPQLADERELRALLDRRKIVRERRESNIKRGRDRFDTHLVRVGAGGANYDAILEICVTPQFPSKQLCSQGELAKRVQEAAFNWRGVQFLGYGSKPITAQESLIIPDRLQLDEPSLFSLDIWGTCYYATKIASEPKNVAGTQLKGISRSAVNGLIVTFLLHAAKMLNGLGYFGTLSIRVQLKSILGVHWLYGAKTGAGIYKKAGAELDYSLSFEIADLSERFFANPYSVALEIYERIYFACNWADSVDTPEKLQSLLEDAFAYCYWHPNEPLMP